MAVCTVRPKAIVRDLDPARPGPALLEMVVSNRRSRDVASRFLDFALSRAAYRGHNEMIRVLLDAVGELGRAFSIHDRSLDARMTAEKIETAAAKTVLRYASRGDSVSAIKRFARPEKGGIVPVYAVFDTTSLDIFQMLYPWAKKHLDPDPMEAYSRHTTQHTTEHLVQSAARRGVVPILDYLLRQVYPGSVSWCADSPPPKATRRGACSISSTKGNWWGSPGRRG